ncbi:hypothetical protein G0Q06_12065 [Puniceicoccales bacterium CK1056]|uniref:Uncharacterized protein n=1 Tax=Oceanipulchritudo coccoides TaxID=2706888 RepID=A0A6B2M2E8_9BACT|nr:hypothetical protein [Oceanipulchritudo coccoides]NDV63191.1 hypothetical protein [Oceanipulchritudo coccoides]
MKKLITLTLFTTAAFAVSAQFTYHEWTFDDPVGTLLEEAANTGDPGTAAWNAGLTHTTDGAGNYLIGNGDISLGYKSANIGPYAGTLTYEIEIDSWDLDNVETFRNIEIQLRDAENASDVVKVQVNQQGSGNVRFRVSDNAGLTNFVFPDYGTLSSVSQTTYVISIQLNTNTGEWETKVNDGPVQASGVATVGSLNVIRFVVGNNPYGTGDDFFKVSRLSLFSTEAAPAAGWFGYDIEADNWVNTGAWLGWVNITNDPWIYLDDLADYIYLPDGQAADAGAWLYVIN